MPQLEFMCLLLSDKGIGPTEAKVEAVVNAREPANSSEVRSFLGLANYNARFIPNFASIAEPLRRLTKKGTKFVFGPEQRASFNELKKTLANAETLGYFDKDAKSRIIADASPVGLGAVLIQEQHGQPRVISYASRSLTNVEKRYSQAEKEALALVWACERFHVYLYGMEFEVYTDHKPLEAIYSTRSKPCARIERWVLRLQPYQFKVKYIPGKQNIADPLSRLSQPRETVQPSKPPPNDAEEFVKFVAVTATPKAMTTREIERASAEDNELSELRRCITTNQWESTQCKKYIPVSSELCVIGKLVLRGTRIVIPQVLRQQTLTLAHEGHIGIVSMKQRLRSKVWWPGINREAERYCKTCHSCQLVSQPSPPEPLKPTTLPQGPWKHLAIDLLGPFPSGDSILVVVDYFSRYYEVKIMKSTISEKIIEALEQIFATHGLPLSVTSDNGPQFISDTIEQCFTNCGIEHRKTTPPWPQANGEVERQNRSLLKRIKIAQAENKNWKKELLTYLIAYRTTPHTTTGVSPAEILFGRKLRCKMPSLAETKNVEDVRDKDAEKKGKAKEYADAKRNAVESDIAVGDQVLLRQKQDNKLTTPFASDVYKVIEKNGNSVEIESPEGVRYKRNITHVKKYRARETGNESSNKEVNQEIKQRRPVRNIALPKKYGDYHMT